MILCGFEGVLGMAWSEEEAPFVLLAFLLSMWLTWMGAVQFDNEGSLRRPWDSGVGLNFVAWMISTAFCMVFLSDYFRAGEKIV